jgi:hypothetical protein
MFGFKRLSGLKSWIKRDDRSLPERSALCPDAQPYQDLIDRLLYAMAGLSEEEAGGLEERLARML